MTLVEHVTTICKTCFLQLRNIAKIRDSLSQKDTEILVHEFISSKLDSCNSLLYGLPQSLIDRLQAVQNCATLLVIRSRNHHANSQTVILASHVQLYQIQDASVNL